MSSSLDAIGYRTGDIVRERDGRHTGTVVAVFEWTVRVRWEETGHKTDFSPDEIELIERARIYIAPMTRTTRPSTVAESPRRQLERWMVEQREQRT